MLRQILALALCLLPMLAFAQVPPEKAISTMTVADGLQIELFASEPMFTNPTSIDVDHKGRVWVCESVNYRHKLMRRPPNRPEGDRIVVLEDTDGDGKADKATTFYQAPDFLAPLGIAVAPYPDGKGCKVFVCHSPHIYVFEDKDGDLKADGPPRILLTGFQGIDHDHGVHGINIGPDGKLYFTVGDAGVKDLQSSDGKGRKWTSNNTDCRAGTVWRCDMDGKNLELIAHNFRNNYECCVNSFGEIWLSDNDDDGNQQTRICYVMPGGDYGYHPRGPGQSHWHEEQPGIVHKVLRTGFGSPTGICFYEGTLLPKKYQGQLLHCDAGPREFRCFHIKPKGAGYELEKELLVTSTDSWFRLSDVCVAPDGSVMLADWYDPGVGGHGMGDTTRGRIYRVTPKGHKGYKVPKVDLDAKDGLIAPFVSPNLATRYLATSNLKSWASQVVAGFNSENAKPSEALQVLGEKVDNLVEAIRSPKASNEEAARWYWATSVNNTGIANRTPLFRPHDLLRERKDVDPHGKLRATAFRIDRDNGNELFFDPHNLLQVEVNGVKSTSAIAKTNEINAVVDGLRAEIGVGRELLLTMRTMEPALVTRLLYPLAKLYDGQDRFYLSALNIACGTDPQRREAILADFDKHFPEWNDKVADLVWELRPKSMLPKMEKLLGDEKLTAKQKARIIDILAAGDDVSAGKTLVSILAGNAPSEIKSRALDNLRRFLPTRWKALSNSTELKRSIDELIKSDETQVSALQLIAAAEMIGMVDIVVELAFSAKASQVQFAATETLGRLSVPKAVDALLELGKIRNQAISALGEQLQRNANNGIGAAALKYLQFLALNPDEGRPERRSQQEAVAALAASQAGSQWLLTRHEKGELPPTLVADAGRLLRNSPFQPVRNKALLLFPAPGKLDPKKLPAIAILAKRTGNADNGRKIMAASLKGEAQCLKCHTVRGVGGQVGPDLSMIGKKASRENLIESILQPSKAIADQYIQWRIETKKGLDIMGLIIEETPDSILLRDANAKDYKIAKSDIDTRTKSAVSIMPENVVSALTEDELIDVAEYMLTLKTASLTPEWWHIVGPFPNDANDSGLDAVYEPEKKVDLSATYASPQRKQGWTRISRNGEGYVDLMAHYAPKSDNIMSYLYREIESPVDQEATISLGTDDGSKVWVNGDKVYETRAHDAAVPDKAKVTVKLKKGKNELLLKIVNGNNPHGFYLTILSEQEVKPGK
jgi:putative membrane-bound dehydrogenase-like protein